MPDAAKPYILLVDDTEANLRVLGPLLRNQGWSVAAVTSGAQALELIARRPPDLVLLDVMMPDMDGFEVCRRLHADPATRDLPVLFITALTDEAGIIRGFQEGALDYIVKPFRPDELVARVRTQLTLRLTLRKAETQAADLARLNAEKDRFYSILAHDLRSPLAGLLGLCEAMAGAPKEFSPDEVAEAAGEMAKSARNLYQLLENLLEWALLQTGRMECRPESIEISSILHEMAALFSPSAQHKDITMHLEVRSAPAWADRRMVQAVFRNLLSNALKFTPARGSVQLRCRTESKRVVGEIEDSGVGLSDAQLRSLFFRESKPVSHPGTAGERGTGLGLVLCAEMLERLGGTITARRAPVKGSIFTITLPIAPGPR